MPLAGVRDHVGAHVARRERESLQIVVEPVNDRDDGGMTTVGAAHVHAHVPHSLPPLLVAGVTALHNLDRYSPTEVAVILPSD